MSYQTVNPAGAKELFDSDAPWIYLDVRTVEEFEAGHAPGAYNIPAFFRGPTGMEPNPDFVAAVQAAFPPESQLILGCAAGMRSAHACELLASEGYRHLVNLHGGFSGARDPMGTVVQPGWAACGYEVTTECPADHSWEALRPG